MGRLTMLKVTIPVYLFDYFLSRVREVELKCEDDSKLGLLRSHLIAVFVKQFQNLSQIRNSKKSSFLKICFCF